MTRSGSPFLTEVLHVLGPLVTKHNLHVAEEIYSRQNFGDALVVLEGKGMRIRILRDRGQTFVDIGSVMNPEAWRSLQQALRASTGSCEVADGPIDLEIAMTLLSQRFDIIREALRP
jgi:hypothetical protein